MKRLSTLLVAVLAAGAAQAGTVSYSFSNDYAPTEINQGGQLHFFDSSLGRLTGISFSFGGGLKTSIDLTNKSNGEELLSATSTSKLFFYSDFSPLNLVLNTGNPLVVLSASVSKTVAGGATSTGNQASDSRHVNWSPAALSALYTSFSRGASDTFGISCKSRSSLTAEGGGGNVAADQSTAGFCDASISYTYDSNNVPEPASLALLGLAATAAGVAGRKRRTQA
ncbi:choice-of-anchor E domain-containing protein [Paucibacter sp. APW11]|uniref:Choice-of-anchor E domain-containing protein n=1 Tax=Roseateles aquae TaxID=3077235 RepID=A0ABU3PAZ8_9BURK|nr:choice-of-anchor E domain-containing protein [Paucibacter sp. APW11]MDT8999756.1 choice-of-anchor E domain-containing protein [Paucibacter sp. APW11]